MPDAPGQPPEKNKEGRSAGFLSGAGAPKPPPPAPAAPPSAPKPAAASGGGASFMGGAGASRTPPPSKSPALPPSPEGETTKVKPTAGSPGFLGGSASATPSKPAAPAASRADAPPPRNTGRVPPPPPAPSHPAAPTETKKDPTSSFLTGMLKDALGETGAPPAPPPVKPPVAQELPAAGQTVPAPAVPAQTPQPLPDPGAPAADFFARGAELSEEGHFTSAITAFRKGLDKEPNNVVARNNLAMIYIELDRLNDARTELEEAASLGSGFSEIYNNLGFVLRKQGRDAEAAKAYAAYLELTPDAEEAERIREWIGKVQADSPAPSPAAPEETAEQPGGAGGAVPEAQEEGPALSFLREAERLYDQEDYEGAIAVYNNLLGQDPESGAALAGRGKAEIKAGLYEEGIASLRESEMILGATPEIDYILAFAFRALKRDAEAAERYERYLAADPEAENADRIREWIAGIRSPAANEPATAEATPPPEALATEADPSWAAELEDAPVAAAGTPAVESGESTRLEPRPPAQEGEQKKPAFSVRSAVQAKGSGADTPEMFIKRARDYLENGDDASALAQAQSAVDLAPGSIEAKILIARCFGRRGEFSKAVPILRNALEGSPENAEAWFFLGRCQQETGHAKDATESYEKAAALASGTPLGEQAQALARKARSGDRGVCAGCMESFPIDALATVEGKPLCTECREKRERALGGAMQLDDAVQQVRRAKHLMTDTKRMKRSRHRRRGILRTLFFLILLLALAGFGALWGLKQYRPALYEKVKAALPFLQDELDFGDREPGGALAGRLGSKNTTEEPKPKPVEPPKPVLPPVRIASVPAGRVMVGFPWEYRPALEPLPSGVKVTYAGDFQGARPAGTVGIDTETGIYRILPAPEDAGKRFRLLLSATLEDGRKAEQKVTLAVLPPPAVEPLPMEKPLPYLPGQAALLACGNLQGDKGPELVFAVGEVRSGSLIVLGFAGAAGWKQLPPLALPGRPVGLLVEDFNGDGIGEILVADWWNSALLRYVPGKGGLVLEATESLSARPLLLAGCQGGPGFALYLADGSIVVYDAAADGTLAVCQRAKTPSPGPFRNLILMNLDGQPGEEIVLVTRGEAQPNVYSLSPGPGAEWQGYYVGKGVAEAAVACPLGPEGARRGTALLLATGGGRARLETLSPQAAGGVTSGPYLFLPGSVLSAGTADLDRNGYVDALCLRRGELLVRLQDPAWGEIAVYPFPDPNAVPAGPAATGDFDGDSSDDLVFLDRAGRLHLATVPASALPAAGGEEEDW